MSNIQVLDLSCNEDRETLSRAFRDKKATGAETVSYYTEKGRQMTLEEAYQARRIRCPCVQDQSFAEHMDLVVSKSCIADSYDAKGRKVEPTNEHYFPLEDTRDPNYQRTSEKYELAPWFKKEGACCAELRKPTRWQIFKKWFRDMKLCIRAWWDL